MAKKITRTILIITIISMTIFVGGIFTVNIITPSFQGGNVINSNLDNKEMDETVPQNDFIREVVNIEQDACCGHTDVTAPSIQLNSPRNNSFVLGGTTIDLKIFDDNPFFEYEVKMVLYHWDGDLSNTTLESPHNVVISNSIGTYMLYVYSEDNDGNWGSVKFSFTVTLTYDPPTLEIISPSASNQTFTEMELFSANVTDDNGIFEVKIQIDNVVESIRYPGRKYLMSYNETSNYYDINFNVSSLLNGYHWLVVIVKDLDGVQHTVTDEIDFTVIGGIEELVGGNSPEWDPDKSVLPENISDYIDDDILLDYEAEVGDVFFKIGVFDEVGIASVDFTVYALDDFDNSTGEYEISNAQIELSQSLIQSDSDGDWLIYEYTWDSTSSLDNYYLCEFEIQDLDTITNRLIIRIILRTDNVVDDQPIVDFGSPGFEVLIPIFTLSSLVLIAPLLKRNKGKKNH